MCNSFLLSSKHNISSVINLIKCEKSNLFLSPWRFVNKLEIIATKLFHTSRNGPSKILFFFSSLVLKEKKLRNGGDLGKRPWWLQRRSSDGEHQPRSWTSTTTKRSYSYHKIHEETRLCPLVLCPFLTKGVHFCYSQSPNNKKQKTKKNLSPIFLVFRLFSMKISSVQWNYSVSYFVAIALFSVDGGDSWNVLFDIRRLCIGGCKRPTRQSRDSSGDRHRLGTHRHGSCLLSRSHLGRSFQSGGHDCVRILRPFPSQTGQHIHTIYNTYQVLFLCVILSLMNKLEPWRFVFDNSSLAVFLIVLHATNFNNKDFFLS